MKFRNALVAATVLALPIAANAQPITGLYIGGGGGVNIMQNENAKVSSPRAVGNGDLHTRVGPAAAASVGFGLGNGLRAEIEGDYRYNTFSGASGGATGGGKETKAGVMANVLYDFVSIPYVQPYVGVGAGYQWAKEQDLHVAAPGFRAAARNSTEGKFAYQGIVGAAVPIPDARVWLLLLTIGSWGSLAIATTAGPSMASRQRSS